MYHLKINSGGCIPETPLTYLPKYALKCSILKNDLSVSM